MSDSTNFARISFMCGWDAARAAHCAWETAPEAVHALAQKAWHQTIAAGQTGQIAAADLPVATAAWLAAWQDGYTAYVGAVEENCQQQDAEYAMFYVNCRHCKQPVEAFIRYNLTHEQRELIAQNSYCLECCN